MNDISIYMTTYNGSSFVEECIESVLNQSFNKFEFVIVDDGSIDDTVIKIEKFKDNRIQLIKSSHNYIQSLNLAVRKSKGKYLAKMDADDIMPKNRLSIQFNYLENHKDVDLLAGGMRFFGNSSDIYIPKINSRSIVLSDMLENNIIAHPTIMIRRKSLLKLSAIYEEDFIYAEDYKLWLSMLEQGLVLDNIPDILNEYRVSEQQISYMKRQKLMETTTRIKMMYQNEVSKIH